MMMDLEGMNMNEVKELIGQLREMKFEAYMQAQDSRAYLHVQEQATEAINPFEGISVI